MGSGKRQILVLVMNVEVGSPGKIVATISAPSPFIHGEDNSTDAGKFADTELRDEGETSVNRIRVNGGSTQMLGVVPKVWNCLEMKGFLEAYNFSCSKIIEGEHQ